MPIRFACEHCGARLSVSSRKAGAQAKCPKCDQRITVPASAGGNRSAKPDREEQPRADSSGEGVRDDPFAEFIVYDDEPELIYATEDEESPPYAEDVPVDPTRVAVPRKILYLQGALLAVVATVCFVLGILVGLGIPGGDDRPQGPQPCLLSGKIAVRDGADQPSPDPGAVAIVVPCTQHPEQKAEIEGLRPQDPLPDETHPGLQAIRSIGGAYTRADENGQFQLRVPDTGEYYLLVISAGKLASGGERPKSELAQIGRFFQLSPDLFGRNAYRWQEETVRRDREVNIVF